MGKSKKTNFPVKKTRMVRIINGEKKEGYYCRIVTADTVDVDDIIDDASEKTTMHRAEITMAITLFIESAAKSLKKGNPVDLGPLGKITPTASGKWAEDPDDLKLSDLDAKLSYRPSEELSESVEKSKFHWATKEKETPTEEEEEDEPEITGEITHDSSTGTVDTSTGTVDTSTGSNSGGDDIPSGNG